jgi:hypothetical protein
VLFWRFPFATKAVYFIHTVDSPLKLNNSCQNNAKNAGPVEHGRDRQQPTRLRSILRAPPPRAPLSLIGVAGAAHLIELLSE